VFRVLQTEQKLVCAGCSIEHDGHFQRGWAAGFVARGGDASNNDVFNGVWPNVIVEFGIDFSIVDETEDFGCAVVGIASARHFSGYFLKNSSWARANLGQENGTIFPKTFGFVISIWTVLIGSNVIELFVWIDDSIWLGVDCPPLSKFGTDKASFRISGGGNVRWTFLLGSIELSLFEILHWIPQSFSWVFTGFRIGEAAADVCSSIVEIDKGSLSKVRFKRIQSCKVRRRSLSIYGKRRELIDA